MRNWNSEFKQAFKNYALTKGEAGEMIVTGVEVIIDRPDFNGINNSDIGYKRYEKDEKRFEKFLRDKKDLLSTLLLRMDREIMNKVQVRNRHSYRCLLLNQQFADSH
jgi:hypothetical protein